MLAIKASLTKTDRVQFWLGSMVANWAKIAIFTRQKPTYPEVFLLADSLSHVETDKETERTKVGQATQATVVSNRLCILTKDVAGTEESEDTYKLESVNR